MQSPGRRMWKSSIRSSAVPRRKPPKDRKLVRRRRSIHSGQQCARRGAAGCGPPGSPHSCLTDAHSQRRHRRHGAGHPPPAGKQATPMRNQVECCWCQCSVGLPQIALNSFSSITRQHGKPAANCFWGKQAIRVVCRGTSSRQTWQSSRWAPACCACWERLCWATGQMACSQVR